MEKVTLDCYPGPEDLKTVLNAIRLLLEPQHVRKGMDLGPCAVSEGGETLVMDHGGNMPDAAHPDEMEPRRA